MQTVSTSTPPVKYDNPQKQHRDYRVERQFVSPRRLKELVRDLLRAHSGE